MAAKRNHHGDPEKEAAYQRRPKQVRKRMARNRARYAAAKKAGGGNVALGRKKLKGKDVDHKDFNPLNNSPGNLRTIAQSRNRSRQPKRR